MMALDQASSIQPLKVAGRQGPLAGFLHIPKGWPDAPCVILCHGLMSSMESPKFKMLAEELRARGLAALRFDFSGCGASEGDLRETTVSGRLEDLQRVIECLRGELGHRGLLGLMGSSMGGYVSLLALGVRSDISATCVWATPFAPIELIALRDHQDTQKLSPAFFQDLRNHNLHSMAGRIHHLLVIHGEKDEVVPAEHGRRLHELASPPKKLSLISMADHRFTNPAHREEAMQLTLEWFSIHLSPGQGSAPLPPP